MKKNDSTQTLCKCQNVCATMTFRRFVYMFRFRYLLHSPHLMNRLNEFASLCARTQVIHILDEKKNIELIESIKISTKQNYLMMYKN